MFEAEPLRTAERVLCSQRRKCIDFEAFMGPGGHWDRHRLVIGSHQSAYDRCHRITLIDHCHAPYPVHSLARPYLAEITRAQLPKFTRPRPTIPDDQLLERSAPLYFGGPCSGELAYIDLTAAYWQLYRVASLDLDYDGTGTPRQGQIKFLGSDELFPHKLLRNSIIGTVRAETVTESNYGTISVVPVGPKWRRPALWAWIMDMLEAIAWDVRVTFGAKMVQVDGYIVGADVAEQLVHHLRTAWGIESMTKSVGFGKLTSLGNWQIADEIRGHPEPHVAGAERVDTMVPRDWTILREWYVEAKQIKEETSLISCKGLDGRLVPW